MYVYTHFFFPQNQRSVNLENLGSWLEWGGPHAIYKESPLNNLES